MMTKNLLFLFFLGILNLNSYAQSPITVGTGSFITTYNIYGPFTTNVAAGAQWNRNAYIYPASLLTGMSANSVTDTIQFYRSTATGTITGSPNCKIYFKNTTATDFGASALDWTTEVATTTLVFNGDPTSNIGSAAGFVKFPLSGGFTYSGNNLEILVEYTQPTPQAATIQWAYDNAGGVPAYTTNQGKYINATTGAPTTSLSNSNERHPMFRLNFSAPVLANDMTISAAVAPLNNSSIVNGSPNVITVTVKNLGTASQTAVPVYYKVDGGAAVGPVSTTGSLAQNSTQNVTLPSYTPTTSGYKTIKVYTQLSGDQNTPNDTLTLTLLSAPITNLPYFENFTSAIGWTANLTLWGISPVTLEANGSGGKAAKADFYNGVAGTRDTLRSPIFNFAGKNRPVLSYNVAYRSATTATPENDSLSIIVSIDGGTTWSAPLNLKSNNSSPSLSTLTPSTTSYIANLRSDWRHELVDLNAYVGQTNVKIGFVANSQYGNNLYLDNVTLSDASSYSSQAVSAIGAQTQNNGVIVTFSNICQNGNLKIAKFNNNTPVASGFVTNTTATTNDASVFTPTNISKDFWYTITYDSVANYSISIDVTALSNAPVPNKLYIVKRSSQNDAWQAVNTTFATNRLSATGLTAFSDFAIAGGSDNPLLPIQLSSFTGVREGARNILNWSTANETNNKGFELQRSISGEKFSTIASIASKAENGNSSSTLSYTYFDEKPLAGTNYYRLRQIDFNGKETFSNIVVLKSAAITKAEITRVYPNPVEAQLNLVLNTPNSEKVNIRITDLVGKVISEKVLQTNQGDNNVQFNTSNLSRGTYFIKVYSSNNNEMSIQKFIKQ